MRFKQPVIFFAAVLVFISIIYTPFQFQGRYLGRHWLFNDTYSKTTIDTGRLLVDWVLIGFLSIGLNYISTLFNQKQIRSFLMLGIPILRILNMFIWLIIVLNTLGFFFAIISNETPASYYYQKIIDMPILIAIFFTLKKCVNWLHSRFYGTPHPSLAKFWST